MPTVSKSSPAPCIGKRSHEHHWCQPGKGCLSPYLFLSPSLSPSISLRSIEILALPLSLALSFFFRSLSLPGHSRCFLALPNQPALPLSRALFVLSLSLSLCAWTPPPFLSTAQPAGPPSLSSSRALSLSLSLCAWMPPSFLSATQSVGPSFALPLSCALFLLMLSLCTWTPPPFFGAAQPAGPLFTLPLSHALFLLMHSLCAWTLPPFLNVAQPAGPPFTLPLSRALFLLTLSLCLDAAVVSRCCPTGRPSFHPSSLSHTLSSYALSLCLDIAAVSQCCPTGRPSLYLTLSFFFLSLSLCLDAVGRHFSSASLSISLLDLGRCCPTDWPSLSLALSFFFLSLSLHLDATGQRFSLLICNVSSSYACWKKELVWIVSSWAYHLDS